MSIVIQDVVRGAIKVDSLPDRACFNSFEEFIQALPNYLSVEVPTKISGVLVSREPPSEDDRDKIWFRRNSSGAYAGIYAFQNGKWQRLFQFVQDGALEIIWVYGNSNQIPDGFVLIQDGDTQILSTVVHAIMGHYVPIVGGGFSYFAMRYIGFS